MNIPLKDTRIFAFKEDEAAPTSDRFKTPRRNLIHLYFAVDILEKKIFNLIEGSFGVFETISSDIFFDFSGKVDNIGPAFRAQRASAIFQELKIFFPINPVVLL